MNVILEQINSTGKAFVEFALAGLVQSSVLIVILLLVDLVLRRKLRAVFRYWLWMLVLAKLVLPTSLSSPVSLGYWFGDKLENVKIVRQTTAVNPQEAPQPTELEPIEVGISTPPVISPPAEIIKPSVTPEIATEPTVPARAVTPVTWQAAVFLVWLAVALGMGLLLLQRAIFVRGLVAQAREANSLMNDAFEFCRKQMGVKRKVALKVSANATSPAVCGIWCYVILLPRNLGRSLGSRDLRAVLLHELAHIKRGDLWVNFVQTVLQIIYFYNPLLWFANAIIRRVREQAVDEAVLVAMGEKAQWYPQTLVSVAKLAFKRPALSLRLIGVVESKSALTGRIKRILNRPMPKTAKLGALGLFAILVTAAVLLPMARVEKNEDANSLPKMTFDPPEMKLRAKRTYGIDEPIELYLSWAHNGWVQTADNRAPENKGKWILLLRVNGTDYRQGEYPILVPDHITAGVTRLGRHFHASEAYSVDAKPKRIEFPPGKYRVSYVFKDVSAVRPDEPENVVHFGDIATNEVEFDVVDGGAGRSSKFKATLSNGVTVELVGVCEHPSEGKQWWRPDGTVLEESPFDEVRIDGAPEAKDGQRAYEIAIRMPESVENYSLSASGETADVHSGYAAGKPRKDGNVLNDLEVAVVYLPESLETTSVRLPLSNPWETRAVYRGNGKWEPPVKTTTTERGGTSYYWVGKSGRGGSEDVYFSDPTSAFMPKDVFEGRFEDEVIWVHTADKLLGQEHRIVAIDLDGKKHYPAESRSGIANSNLRHTSCEFWNFQLDQLKELHFETWSFDIVEFRNVSLGPGRKTSVEVEVKGSEAGVALPMARAKETSVALAGRNAQADQQRRVRELMYILRNHTLSLSLGRTEQWIAAIKELAEIGKPAVPELAAELDRTDRDSVVRAIAFTLRAIGDPRAVPALIRALPKTATRGSDLGMTVHDSNLHAFMVKHHISGREEYPRFGYKRAVREITAALEKITSHSEGKEHIRAARSDDADAIKAAQDKRTLAAKRWGDWWSKHWQEFLSEEELDSATIGPREGDPIEAAGIAKFGPPIPSGKEFRLGAVVEMFVPPFHTDFWDSQAYLDLDTGKLLTKFEGGRPASGDLIVYRWYVQAGVDARVNHWFNSDKKRSGYRLKGFDTHVWQIDNSRWKTMEDEIRSEIPLKLGPPNSRPDFFPRNRSGDWPGYDLSDFPATFLFTTREGSAGVLQIIDASENAEGVWIRYRMVEGPGLEARPAVIGTARKGESAGGGEVFGSVTEMTVLRPDAKTDNTIDFDSGRLSTSPLGIKYPLSTALREWLRQSGADVVSVITNKRKKVSQLALAGDQMITMPVSSAAWETMTAAQLIDFLARDTAREDVLLKVRVGKRGKRMAVMPRSSSGQSRPTPTLEPVLGPLRKGWQEMRAKLAEDLPRIFLFKTREGGMGILQITGFTGKNKGVRIRYKMVQKGQSEKIDAEAGENISAVTVGCIVDGSGMGIAGATMEFHRWDRDEKKATEHQIIKTGKDGSFVIPYIEPGRNGSFTNITAPGFATREEVSFVHNTDGTYYPKHKAIQLFRLGSIAGTVLDLDGKPLAGAPLSLSTAVQYQYPRHSIHTINHIRAITDANGHFSMKVPPGTHLLSYPWMGPIMGEVWSGKWDKWKKPGERYPSAPIRGVSWVKGITMSEGQAISEIVADLSKSTCDVAGNPNHVLIPNEADLDGHPRIIAARVDMGSDEFYGKNAMAEPVNGVKARIESVGPFILWKQKSNIVLEVQNRSNQKMQVAYPPESVWKDGLSWTGQGRVELFDSNGLAVKARSSSRKPFLYLLEPNEQGLKTQRVLSEYMFDFPSPGKYRLRITLEVEPMENGKTFKVSTNWLEFDAVLTGHQQGTPYTAQEAFEEAMAYDAILFAHKKISRDQTIDKFLSVARLYPNSEYSMKSYWYAAAVATKCSALGTGDDLPIDKQKARACWQEVVNRWPEVISKETIDARDNLGGTDKNQFEKWLDYYEWLTSRTEEQKIKSVKRWMDVPYNEEEITKRLKRLNKHLADALEQIEFELTDYRNANQLRTIIKRFPNTHLAELAQKELSKRNSTTEVR